MKINILVLVLFVSILVNACMPSQDESASASIQDINPNGEKDPEQLDSTFYEESFFGEFFEKDRIEIKEGTFVLSIPFDMHGPGGLGPDCYITDLSLFFSSEAPFSFPQELYYEEREHGCVDEETNVSGKLILAEDNEGFVQYHSIEPSRMLFLFKNYKKGTLAYYFPQGYLPGITGKNFEFILKKLESSELEDNYPSISSLLTQVE